MRAATALLGAFLAVVASCAAAFSETPTIRIAVLKFGTVNWELNTIKFHQLDAERGFSLDIKGMAGGPAARVALQGGEADMIVADWLWVARQRAAGKDYVFIPYSKSVGGLMIPADSKATTLADLAGSKIGIAGGPLDKSWLILNAYASKMHGIDLKNETEQVFGAPPLIFKTALSGDLDGAINYWHFTAKMEAGGMRKLISTSDAAEALGLDPDMPLLGYVIDGKLLRDNPGLVENFTGASRAAKAILAEDDGEWDRLRDVMKAKSDGQFEALKAGFRAGIPAAGPVDEDSARRMFNLMSELAGEELVGKATELPDGIFVNPGS
ncbi:ABC transporter substrate-binding protein [Hoeflea sp. TYP-13]|uniref:ABC transporter substrate-binding protein n=1 Tax=Hoeflea sp. TYP-13 TaxID=3230023 RepID=UPI0034C60F1C